MAQLAPDVLNELKEIAGRHEASDGTFTRRELQAALGGVSERQAKKVLRELNAEGRLEVVQSIRTPQDDSHYLGKQAVRAYRIIDSLHGG